MDLMSNGNYASNIKPLYDEDLQDYGRNLLHLVKTYKNEVYIYNEEMQQILDRLEQYAYLLIAREYNQLITNSREIIRYENNPNPELPF